MTGGDKTQVHINAKGYILVLPIVVTNERWSSNLVVVNDRFHCIENIKTEMTCEPLSC